MRDASLFAEDGRIFLAGAHNSGPAALADPYAGYLHVVPRAIAAILEPAAVTSAPALYASAALLVHLLMLTPALSRRLDWLVPGKVLRSVLFALLCLMPPMWEVLANIANLIFVGGICLLLLVVSDDPRTRIARAAELLAVGLLGLSGPLIVIFLPWFVWRWWRVGRTPHSTLTAAVAATAAAVQLVTFVQSHRETRGGGTPFLLLKAIYERVGGSWLFGDADVFGRNASVWFVGAAILWCAGVLALSVVVLRGVALALWALAIAVLGSATFAYGTWMTASSLGLQRHIVVPVATVVVLMVAVLGRASRRWQAYAASVLLVLGGGAIWHDFMPEPYAYRPDLGVLQDCLDSSAAICRQPIFNGRWVMVLRN